MQRLEQAQGRAVEQGRSRVRAAIVPSGHAGGPAWKKGDKWESHGICLRLQGMAHLPGVKAGSPNCCLPELCRFLPKDISRMVTQQCGLGRKKPLWCFPTQKPALCVELPE